MMRIISTQSGEGNNRFIKSNEENLTVDQFLYRISCIETVADRYYYHICDNHGKCYHVKASKKPFY